jgi:hypothetical protein
MLARISLRRAPQPNWTRLCSSSLWTGMPRRRAASTSDRVVGPRVSVFLSFRRCSMTSGRSNSGGTPPPTAGAIRSRPVDALEIKRQQAVDQFDRRPAGGPAQALAFIGIEDVVDAGSAAHRARLAARRPRARQGLKFEGDVLDHVAQPGAIAHSKHQPSRRLVGASVLAEARQGGEKLVDDVRKAIGRPGLQRAEIQLDADHRLVGVEVRASIEGGFQDAHHAASAVGSSDPADRSRDRSRMWRITMAAASFLVGARPLAVRRPCSSIVRHSQAWLDVGSIENRVIASVDITHSPFTKCLPGMQKRRRMFEVPRCGIRHFQPVHTEVCSL